MASRGRPLDLIVRELRDFAKIFRCDMRARASTCARANREAGGRSGSSGKSGKSGKSGASTKYKKVSRKGLNICVEWGKRKFTPGNCFVVECLHRRTLRVVADVVEGSESESE